VVVVAVLLAIAYGVSRSPLLAVDTVTVTGASHLTAEQVLDAAGVHEGDALVWLDTGAAVSGIEALPYVRGATLRREWPDTVRITVHERTPAAWVDGPAGKALVDRTGRVLETVEAAPPAMPQLLGATLVPPPGGTIDAVGAARVAGGLTALAAAGTTSVEATDHGIVLHLASGTEVRMGEATQVGVKIRAAFAVLDAMQHAPPAYVDVSVPTNPVAG
jgi:cell division protein FtsQ